MRIKRMDAPKDDGMRLVTVTGTLRLCEGRVKLTPAQAKHRAHNLRDLGEGLFEVVAPIEFKQGESVLMDGIEKAMLAQVNVR